MITVSASEAEAMSGTDTYSNSNFSENSEYLSDFVDDTSYEATESPLEGVFKSIQQNFKK